MIIFHINRGTFGAFSWHIIIEHDRINP
jgi:hypothetical protein